eukprot:CAMPEP_0171198846 /NCGR_PEP_ID=MMETSP0790-20130122/23159_1 /TAXON_ID=2925 /ORGANISM="Alexandrium catenella, Strain OF101" /LENGTH=356 /DNA_ID=CAMNT_0011664175 /DNA_START=84 /DNA_END=1154 /DNA_ORIENTATION=+
MSATLRVCCLAAFITCAPAVRRDGVEDSEFDILARAREGESLGVHANRSAAAGLHGTHVCCITFTEHEGRVNPYLNVFHESAASEIKRCQMAMITGTECHDQTSCMQECKQELQVNRRYNMHIEPEVLARETDEESGIAAFKEDEQKKRDAAIQEAEDAYQQDEQQAQAVVTEAEDATSVAKEREKELQMQLEALQREVEAAEAEVEKTTKHWDGSKAASCKVKKTAKEDVEKNEQSAEAKLGEALAEADQRTKALHEKTTERLEHYGTLVDQPVPEECKGDVSKHGPYAAVACCCSINGVPMMVDGHFADWNMCMTPTKYATNVMDIFGAGCSLYRECAKCRQLVCGTGMCPTKI